MAWRLKRVHLPSFGVAALFLGGLLRLLAAYLAWPFLLVLTSEIILLLAVMWLAVFDFLPIIFPPLATFKAKYEKRWLFFLVLLLFFAFMQTVASFLPSGRAKDMTITLAFLSFVGGIVWIIFIYLATNFTPLWRYLRRKPKEPERVTFGDIVTSMAVIILPTVVLSFLFSPPGLKTTIVTPYQVFTTSALTNVFILSYLYLFVIRPKVFSWRQLGWRKVSREGLARMFVLFLLVAVAIAVLDGLLRRLGVPLSQYSFTSKEGAGLALAMAVLVTPIAEELYFRGFLFRGLQLHHKLSIAYLISALLFALLHPPILVMGAAFIIGLLLAYVIQETKSIWPGVVIHALNNAVVMGYLLIR